jgi:isopentenyl phosphate kinase
MDVLSIQQALDGGLVPMVYGDVAFDRAIGGTIISTEEIFTFLSLKLHPASIWLAGDVPGVLDEQGVPVPDITPANLADVRHMLGGSGGTDVTGGMVSKVETMLNLCKEQPGLSVHIFSGLEKQLIGHAVAGRSVPGTTIHAS